MLPASKARARVTASSTAERGSEAGWMVTELGRQPWVVYGVLRTADAVTPMPGLVIPFVGISILYLFLSAIVVWLLHDQMVRVPAALAGTPAAHPAAGEASRS